MDSIIAGHYIFPPYPTQIYNLKLCIAILNSPVAYEELDISCSILAAAKGIKLRCRTIKDDDSAIGIFEPLRRGWSGVCEAEISSRRQTEDAVGLFVKRSIR